jgi:serine/threonine protein kinase/formylglycine-generating enzyme required for sulfatase activity
MSSSDSSSEGNSEESATVGTAIGRRESPRLRDAILLFAVSQPSLQPEPGADGADPAPRPSREIARDLFAEFTFLRERGDAPSFERWVSGHARHDRELRVEHARWLAMQSRVAALAFDTAEASTPHAEETGEIRALIESIRARRDAVDRYETLGRVGRGGMGVVYKVRDRHLDRVVGMKVLRRRPRRPEGSPGVGSRSLQRFLEEARIASRLNHPGIVPVHELGCDERGRVYFTMGFVEGQDLGRILRERAEGRGAWTRERVLDILLRVCEAVTHAHDHDVLHRDLKPSNVMVGSLGQAYVTDWGLARLRTGIEEKDPVADPDSFSEADAWAGGAIVAHTRTGEAIGTLAYMSPEQARGEHDRVGPASDVYSLGAILYEVLSLRRPYARESGQLAASDLLRHLRAHPPEPVEDVARDAPAELCAICRRAMQREPRDRYPSARELAADLRAYLEGRVVAAHRTDRLEKITKWIRRNRALAGALLGVLVLAVGALVAISWLSADARSRTEQVFRLAARQDLDSLRQGADELWPPYPGRIDEYEAWLENAHLAIQRLDQERATLAELEAHSTLKPLADWIEVHREHPKVVELERARADAAEIEEYSARTGDTPPPGFEERVAALERDLPTFDRREFTKGSDRWWHDQVLLLIAETETFADPDHGCVEGVSEEHGWGVRRRLEFARALAARDDRTAWDETIAAVRADGRYGGLELRPQAGLVPLGRDPCSGLFEFAHLQSGNPAKRDPETGCLSIDAHTGIVLVLIPAGVVEMGGQADPARPHFDAHVGRMEQPRQRVELDAFFLSKFEMSQGEWRAATGGSPSYYGGDGGMRKMEDADLHPVENVTWEQCERVLRRMGLTLPTEAQWEYACRGGTETVWYTGDDVASLQGYENLADEAAVTFFNKRIEHEVAIHDGFEIHAPVGSLQANPFGLHDMVGNVSEWCRDWIGFLGSPVRRGDGERLEINRSRTVRGSSFYGMAERGRPSERRYRLPTEQDLMLGCRPSRAIE